MKIKKSRVGIVGLLAAALLATGGATASASTITEPVTEPDVIEVDSLDDATIEFDVYANEAQEQQFELPSGEVFTIGATPDNAASEGVHARAGLRGTWTVWGDNGLARMEYKVDLIPEGGKTRINRTHSLKITGRISSFSNESMQYIRRLETSAYAAEVQGYASFNYLENQWVTIWTQSGGVNTKIKDGKVTSKLY